MVQNTLVKFMLAPQSRSGKFLVGHVENQPAILQK
jgi:hypothetical protein